MNGINVTYNITGSLDDSAGDVGPNTPQVFDPCAAENDTGKDYAAFYRTAQFVTGLICYPIICLVGLTGNSFCLFLLLFCKKLHVFLFIRRQRLMYSTRVCSLVNLRGGWVGGVGGWVGGG